ncbi:hypothetical protein BGX26_000823 [Mortierella sp. AD094]|nr:hypothetical protein BGX26_000823 [Mortierella sp. AD094]
MDNEVKDFKDMEAVKTACYDETFSIPSKETRCLLDEFVEAMDPDRDLWQLKRFCRREQFRATEGRTENSDRTKSFNAVEYLPVHHDSGCQRTGATGLKETRLDRKKSEWFFALNDHNIKRSVDQPT